ncbi:hypothetical protein ABIA54_004867 [Pseudomonas sp. EB276 TE3739]|nr:hypothetical protein [Pseudomonas koreensis]
MASYQSANHSTDPPQSRAGSLLHCYVPNHRSSSNPQSRWERACSRRGRHIQHLHCLTQCIREQARSHSFRGMCKTRQHTKPNVGVSLLAMASYQSANHSTDPPQSRAGSLLHCYVLNHRSAFNPQSRWERACSRRRRHIQHLHCLTQCIREQARSHRRPALLVELGIRRPFKTQAGLLPSSGSCSYHCAYGVLVTLKRL